MAFTYTHEADSKDTMASPWKSCMNALNEHWKPISDFGLCGGSRYGTRNESNQIDCILGTKYDSEECTTQHRLVISDFRLRDARQDNEARFKTDSR
uniref:Uncharacterized protein n=1 Tax=Octopus bimaculoides TaxID=37653 RepID=A0A0L8FQX2_OCTBM